MRRRNRWCFSSFPILRRMAKGRRMARQETQVTVGDNSLRSKAEGGYLPYGGSKERNPVHDLRLGAFKQGLQLGVPTGALQLGKVDLPMFPRPSRLLKSTSSLVDFGRLPKIGGDANLESARYRLGLGIRPNRPLDRTVFPQPASPFTPMLPGAQSVKRNLPLRRLPGAEMPPKQLRQ